MLINFSQYVQLRTCQIVNHVQLTMRQIGSTAGNQTGGGTYRRRVNHVDNLSSSIHINIRFNNMCFQRYCQLTCNHMRTLGSTKDWITSYLTVFKYSYCEHSLSKFCIKNYVELSRIHFFLNINGCI